MAIKLNKKIARRTVGLALLGGLASTTITSIAGQQPSAYTKAYRYNESGQLTAVISPSPDGTAKYPTVRNIYDTHGRLERIDHGVLFIWQDETWEPRYWPTIAYKPDRSTVFTYDGLGRKATESVRGSDGVPISLTQYSYDEFGRVECKTVRMNPAEYGVLPDACTLGTEGPAGPDRITRYEYYIDNMVRNEKRGVGTPLEQTYLEKRYDKPDTFLVSDHLDANGNLTHFEYDARARLSRMYFPQKVVSPTPAYSSSDYEEYGYDANSNRTSLRKRDGKTITSIYDNLNRIVRKDVPNADGSVTSTYQGYDLSGRLKHARFASQTGPGIAMTYNGFGDLVTEETQIGASYSLAYKYDLNGNRTTITHSPGGSYYTYAYDQLDQLKNVFESGTTNLITYSYDVRVRLQSLTTGGGLKTTLEYDSASRPNVLKLDPAGTAYDVNYLSAFNPAGQIITQELSNSNYQYLEKGSAAGAYEVNGLNQYTKVGNQIFDHDANGSLKTDGSTTFDYDTENRLVKATGARNAALKYDPLGRLYEISGGSGVTNFVYSGDSLVAEVKAGGATQRYVFGAGIDKPLVSYTVNGTAVTKRFLHSDHQGSVVALTDGTGTVVQTNTYDPYGVPGIDNDGRFAYTGQTYLSELGMHYYKARVYYPQIGRFLQTDPVGYNDQMNLYAYVGNDPVNNVDPTGKFLIGNRGPFIANGCGGSMPCRNNSGFSADQATSSPQALQGIWNDVKAGAEASAKSAFAKAAGFDWTDVSKVPGNASDVNKTTLDAGYLQVSYSVKSDGTSLFVGARATTSLALTNSVERAYTVGKISGFTLKGSTSATFRTLYIGGSVAVAVNPWGHTAGAQVAGGVGSKTDMNALTYRVSSPAPAVGYTWD